MRLYGGLRSLAGADPMGGVECLDVDFTVTTMAGVSCLGDGLSDRLDQLVRHHDFDAHPRGCSDNDFFLTFVGIALTAAAKTPNVRNWLR